jgi:opacity protein-like surface antigen
MTWDKWMMRSLEVAAATAVLALGLLLAVPGYAADKGGDRPSFLPVGDVVQAAPGSWTGVYVGVDGGVHLLDANATRLVRKGTKEVEGEGEAAVTTYTYEPDPISILNADSLGGKDWTYGARIGVDWHVNGTPFVFGVLGGYGWGAIDSSMSFAEQTWASDIGDVKGATFSIEPTWYAGGRIGLAVNSSLLYAGAAWTRAEVDGSVTIAYQGGDKGFAANGSTDGWMLLLGGETKLGPQWTIGAEYSYARYDDVTFVGPHVVVYGDSVRQNSLTVDPDVHAFKVRLNWRPFAK